MAVDNNFERLEEKLNSLVTALTQLRQEKSELENRVAALQRENEDLKSTNERLSAESEKLQELEDCLKFIIFAIESALMDFVSTFKNHVTTEIQSGNKSIFEKKVLPKFNKKFSRNPKNRHEVHKEMKQQPYWQFSGSLSRLYQELKQEVGDSNVYRQSDMLAKKAKNYLKNAKKSSLKLNAQLPIPRYLAAVDIHLLPGCYYTERTKDDVTAGAMYDPGVFMFAMGAMGQFNEDMGTAAIRWLKNKFPKL